MDMENQTAEEGLNPVGWIKTLAGAKTVFYILPWLMVLLTLGTVAQKDLGLYLAHKQYFSSWFLMWGPVPLPGGYLTLAALTACLTAKFLLYSPWHKAKAGIILSHLAIIILLFGGLLTALTQKEGYLMLAEGQNGAAISDYHDRIFTIEKDQNIIADIPYDDLRKNETLAIKDLPFKVRIDDLCNNCKPALVKDEPGRHGFAHEVALLDAPAEAENEANLSGITFSVFGAPDNQDGIWAVMEEIPHRPVVMFDDINYSFHIGRAQRTLPFTVELVDFRRELHPGTDVARGFASDVIVHDGAVEWPVTIRMNEPLRYKGYTFYQASFAIRPDGEYSVLSVVENKGRVFPYIASALLFIGLLLHLVIRMNAGRKNV